MIAFSIALVVIAGMAAYLINKFLDQRQSELDLEYQVNIDTAHADAIAALDQRLKSFDQRINDTWSTISSTKQELEAHKLAIGIRNR